MQRTLIDPFELRSNLTTQYAYAPPSRAPQAGGREYVARQSIDIEVEWEEEEETVHDWSKSSTESSPGVSIESWRRARGWCAE